MTLTSPRTTAGWEDERSSSHVWCFPACPIGLNVDVNVQYPAVEHVTIRVVFSVKSLKIGGGSLNRYQHQVGFSHGKTRAGEYHETPSPHRITQTNT